jgi:hypothetical protein
MKLFNWIKQIKFMKITLTPEKYKQIVSIIQLLLMVVMFVSGYSILISVNGVIGQYLLAGNLLVVSNLMLYKMK